MHLLRCCRHAAAAAALALAAFSAQADGALPKPQEWVHGYINGYFTLMTYPWSGDTCYPIEVQVKRQGDPDSAYWTIYRGNTAGVQYTYDGRREPFLTAFKTGLGSLVTDSHRLDEWVLATNCYGTSTFRMRANNGTDTSDWVELGDSTAYLRLTGTKMSAKSDGKSLGSSDLAKTDDGKLQNLIDVVECWYGLDLGTTRKVRGIRYYSRSDASYSRINGAYVEYADNSAFVNPTRAFTISTSDATTASRRKITFLRFETPVETRYIRMHSSSDKTQQFSLSEFEVVSAEVPYQPTVTAGYSCDASYRHPKLSWTVPADAYPVSNRVLRATAAAGPYTAISDWAEGVGSSFVDSDTTLKPSVGYYYKVEVWCNHPAIQEETDQKYIVSDPVQVYFARRLDRDSDGKLLSGVSYMTLTSGEAYDNMKLAFDGLDTTRPDSSLLYYGPVGLKFGKATWVTTFGYIGRRDVYCKRIKSVALYSTGADDTALDDKVCRSACPTETDQQGTMYYLDANSLPDGGARQYFLWQGDTTIGTDDSFYGNVAELQFFGWNQDDVDNAGILLPPETVSLSTLATGVRLSWSASACATGGYDVQRRVHGTDDWTTVAGIADKSVTTYDDTGLSTATYDYRVVAKRGEETAASSVYSIIFYVHGSGTGLKSAVYSPFRATTPELCAPTNTYDRGIESPNLAFAAEDAFAPNVLSNAVLAMKGKLIVPIAGTYTLRLDTANGGAVYIDDEWAVNGWVGGSLTGSIALETGEHEIEVHARLQNAENRVKLYWSGPVDEEIIPATQLVPSETAYTFDRGSGWSARFYGGDVRGEVYGGEGDATVLVKASNQARSNWRTDPRMVCMMHDCSSSFTLSARLDDDAHQASGHFGLLVRAANGNFVRFYGDNSGTDHAKAYLSVLTNGVNDCYLMDTGKNYQRYIYDMKLVYDKPSGVFTCYMKVPSTSDYGAPIATWTNDGSIPDKFEVGYFVGGGYSTRTYGDVRFVNRRFHEKKGLAIFLK